MAEADDSVYRLRDRPMIPPKPAGGGVAFTGTAADLVEGVYRARRLRDDAFGPIAGQFREPTWDILLDLYLAAAKGRPVSVSSWRAPGWWCAHPTRWTIGQASSRSPKRRFAASTTGPAGCGACGRRKRPCRAIP